MSQIFITFRSIYRTCLHVSKITGIVVIDTSIEIGSIARNRLKEESCTFFVNCGQTFLRTNLRLPGISVQVTPQGSSVNPRHLGPGPALGTLQTALHSDRLPSGSTTCFTDLTYCWLLGWSPFIKLNVLSILKNGNFFYIKTQNLVSLRT